MLFRKPDFELKIEEENTNANRHHYRIARND
jgi:hypothetical protein